MTKSEINVRQLNLLYLKTAMLDIQVESNFGNSVAQIHYVHQYI